MQGGFELPTRLSVSAADFVISLTVALTKKDKTSDTSNNIKKPPKSISVVDVSGQRKVKPITPVSDFTKDMENYLLLWNLLDHLIALLYHR